MDDFNVGGESSSIAFLGIIFYIFIVVGVIFSIASIYEYMKYSPLLSIGFLSANEKERRI